VLLVAFLATASSAQIPPPDPRDSVILESKIIRPDSGTGGIVRLRVWITNKDTLTNVSIALEEKSLSDNAYLKLAQPRTFAGTVTRLTGTLGNYPTTSFSKYDDVSPDSFTLASFYDPADAAHSVEPPNPARKAFWDIKFDTASTAAAGGTVQFDTAKVFNVSTQFVDIRGQDIGINFVKGLIVIIRRFPDMPLNFPPNAALLLARRPTFQWRGPHARPFCQKKPR